MRILVVEDQQEMSALIADRMRRAGFVADCVGLLDDARAALQAYDYPIMLLDRRMPDGDGLRALPDIRKIRPGIRIIVVSALNGPEDRVEGLETGADDYLAKPFYANELLARIRACLRRAGDVESPMVEVGRLSFSLPSHQALVADRQIDLNRKESLFLESLVRRAERFVAYSTIFEEVYGVDEDVTIDALRMLAVRLRQKLKNEELDVELVSSRGVGYMLRKARR